MNGEVGFSQIGAANTRLIIFILPDYTHYFGWFSQNAELNTLINYIKSSINVRDRDKYKWLLGPEQDGSKLPYKVCLETEEGLKEIQRDKFKKALSSLNISGPFVKIFIKQNEELFPPEQKQDFIPKKKEKNWKSI